jgi:hypothetical protein
MVSVQLGPAPHCGPITQHEQHRTGDRLGGGGCIWEVSLLQRRLHPVVAAAAAPAAVAAVAPVAVVGEGRAAAAAGEGGATEGAGERGSGSREGCWSLSIASHSSLFKWWLARVKRELELGQLKWV